MSVQVMSLMYIISMPSHQIILLAFLLVMLYSYIIEICRDQLLVYYPSCKYNLKMVVYSGQKCWGLFLIISKAIWMRGSQVKDM